MSFEEYLNINYNEKLDDLTKFLINDAFKAGAQSRQAEIDCLMVELNGANERALMLLNHKNNMVDKMQAEIDELKTTIVKYEAGLRKNKSNKHKLLAKNIELQKRVNKAMKYVSESPLKDVSRRAMINFMDILKGNKDES